MSSSSGLILIINVFAGIGLKQIWKAVNILQFIIYTNDWKLSPPANQKVFFSQVQFFARGDWIPKKKIMSMLHLETSSEDKQAEQTKFLLLVCAVGALFVILATVGIYLLRKSPHWMTLINEIEKVKRSMIWGGVVRMWMQSSLDFAVTAALMFMIDKESKTPVFLKPIAGFFFTLLLLAAPVALGWYVHKLKEEGRLEEQSDKEKWGILWDSYKTRDSWAIMYIPVFLVRRIIFAFISVHIGYRSGCLVLMSVLYLSLGQQIGYLVSVKPYTDPEEFYMEVFSEICLMYFFYGVLITELCVDPKTKFRFGWFAAAWVAILFLI